MNASSKAGSAKAPQREDKDTRQFKSKVLKDDKKRFGDDLPGMEGLGTAEDICPLVSYGDMELSDLAQFGIV